MQENKTTLDHYPLGRKEYISKTDGDYRTEQSLLVKLTLALVKQQLKYLKRKYLNREEISQCTKDTQQTTLKSQCVCMQWLYTFSYFHHSRCTTSHN